jgi:antirestriction protein ArdC
MAMSNERFDIHQHITDKIVSAIERGAGDFRLPWHRSAGSIMRPVNVASRKAYRGINVVALWAYAEESGCSSGVWGTYRQWAETGAQVRKGEKAAFVVLYKELEFAAETETADPDTITRLFAGATPVFAAEQVDGYQPPVIDAPPATVITPLEHAEAFVSATAASGANASSCSRVSTTFPAPFARSFARCERSLLARRDRSPARSIADAADCA